MKKIILSMLLTLIMHFNLPASKEIIDNKPQNIINYLKNAQKINSKKAWLGPFFRNPAKETNEIPKKIFQFIFITGTVYFIFAPIANNNNILDPNADYITQIFTHCFSTLSSCKTILTKIRERNFVDSLSYLKDCFHKRNFKNLTISHIISYVVIVSENQQEITNHNDTKELADEYEEKTTSNLKYRQAQIEAQNTVISSREILHTALQKHDNEKSEKSMSLAWENINLKKELEELKESLNSKQTNIDDLNSALKTQKIQLDKQTANVNLTLKNNGKLMEENEELKTTLLSTRENLAELQNHCDKNNMAMQDLRSQSTTTKLENAKLQSNLIFLKEEIKNKNEQLTNKQVFSKKENPTVIQLQDETIQGLQSQLKILQKEIENLKSQLEEHSNKIKILEIPIELEIEPEETLALKTENDELKIKEETTRLKNENDELQKKIAALEKTIKRIQFENKFYQNCKERNIVFQTFLNHNPNHENQQIIQTVKKNHTNSKKKS